MTSRLLRLGRLFLYAALSLLDLGLTYYLLERGGGHVYEGNPLANAWLSAYGWTGLAGFKIACMALVLGVAALLSIRRPQAADRLLTFACTAAMLVVLYSCSLVGFFGKGFPETVGLRTMAANTPPGFLNPPGLETLGVRPGDVFLRRTRKGFLIQKELRDQRGSPPPLVAIGANRLPIPQDVSEARPTN
jgi:hypothetical protein